MRIQSILRRLRPAHRVLLVLFVVTLGVRVWHLIGHLTSPLAHPELIAVHTDIAAFSQWAKAIAAGDWLDRGFFHPVMDWMPDYGTKEQFERWWGGAEVYHQNPLYPYLLAVSYLLTDSSVPLLLLQVLCSSASILFVFDLGRRLLDERAGLVAAGLAGLFMTSIVFDTVLLRASFNSSLTLASIWCLLYLRDAPRWRRGLLAGVVLGAGYMLRPTGLALLLVGPLVLLATSARQGSRTWLPAVALGVALVVGPFAARNIAVGAPVLRFSTRGPETILQANSRGAEPGFMQLCGPEDYRRLLDAGHRSMGDALSVSIGSWPDGGLSWWLGLLWQKTLCVFRDYEYANNINVYFYRRSTALLGVLPTFGWFVGLGLVGVVLAWRWGRDRAAWWVLFVALGALYAGTVLGFALSRYRAPLAVLMTVPAGVAVSLAWAWLRSGARRQVIRAAVVLVLSGALSVLAYTVLPARTTFDPQGNAHRESPALRRLIEGVVAMRWQEFGQTARVLYGRGRSAEASQGLAAHLEEFRRYYIANEPHLLGLSDHGPLLWLQGAFRRRLLSVASELERGGDAQRARICRDAAEKIPVPGGR